MGISRHRRNRRCGRRRRQPETKVRFLNLHTGNLIAEKSQIPWREVSEGKPTFAFLDTTIPHRALEFEYISDPRNGVLDFSRPLCVCIHDMSRYRHPSNADTSHLASTLRRVDRLCKERGWQSLRLNQSRGLLILVKYPPAAGIDGTCLVPEELNRAAG